MKRFALVALLSSSVLLAQSPTRDAQIRAAFLKLVDASRVDPAPAVRPMAASAPRLVQEHISFSVIYGEFDAPAMLPLIAPRPMLVINGDSDPRTPMAGVRESAAAAERVYKAAGASDRFVLRVIPNLGHENTPEIESAMIEWFVRWLRP